MYNLEGKTFFKALFSTVYGWIMLATLLALIVGTVMAFNAGNIVLGVILIILTLVYLVGAYFLLSGLFIVIYIILAFLSVFARVFFPFGWLH